MLYNQIAVFLENKTGRLDALVKAVSGADINIKSLNIADTNDFGIVRLITDDNEGALEVIRSTGFTASSVDLVGIEVSDKPGSLAAVLEILSENGLSIEYLYSFSCSEGRNLILFKTVDADTAQKVLKEHNI